MREHYSHMKAHYGDFEKIVHEDQLNLEAHFDSWTAETRFPVAFTRYDDLWSRQDDIGRFLDLDLRLPPRRARQASGADPDLRRAVAPTYSRLAEKVRTAKAFWTNDA